MAKGIFKLSIPVSLGEVRHTPNAVVGDSWFSVSFPVFDRFGEPAGSLRVRYYGKRKRRDMFYVRSFIYSVQHLPRYVQEAWNSDIYATAKFGLQIVGVVF